MHTVQHPDTHIAILNTDINMVYFDNISGEDVIKRFFFCKRWSIKNILGEVEKGEIQKSTKTDKITLQWEVLIKSW